MGVKVERNGMAVGRIRAKEVRHRRDDSIAVLVRHPALQRAAVANRHRSLVADKRIERVYARLDERNKIICIHDHDYYFNGNWPTESTGVELGTNEFVFAKHKTF